MARKIISLEDRLPQLKKERKKKANRRFALYALVFFLLLIAVVYFQSPLSRVTDIQVSGQQIASKASVLKASGLSMRTHIWDVHAAAIENGIRKLPSIEHAAVSISFPNRVSIRVQEYGRKAYLLRGGRYYPILENGSTLPALRAQQLPMDAPILIGFHKKEALKQVAEGLAHIPQAIIHTLSDIHYIHRASSGNDLMLYMNDGNKVVASTRTFAQNIRLYPEIAANLPKGRTGTIYLSVGSYYVPDSESTGNK
ncbi:MAG: FtsQ-type POTRA domain-containing protein [Sporolactobacillus sp.]